MHVATNVAGTMNSGVGVVRRTAGNSKRSTRAKQNSRMFAGVIIAGIMCLMIVVMSAFAAKLNQENNQLQKKNDSFVNPLSKGWQLLHQTAFPDP